MSAAKLERGLPANGGLSQAVFATQYLTIILIILTFTIGGIVRDRLSPKVVEQLDLPSVTTTQISKRFSLDDFFELNGVKPSQEKLDALIALFANHDIELKVTTFPEILEVDELSLGISRALSIRRALEAQLGTEALVAFSATAKFDERGNHILVEMKGL